MSMLSQDKEVFWPPADELLEAAERIRRRLGDWPAGSKQWRICLSEPDHPRPGDLIVDGGVEPLPQGVGRLAVETGRATLHLDNVEYVLEGEWSDDWPAARSEEHTSELQSHHDLVCRLLLEK